MKVHPLRLPHHHNAFLQLIGDEVGMEGVILGWRGRSFQNRQKREK